MSEIMTMQSIPDSLSAPLTENQYVKELFGILSENGKDSSGLSALINHVSGMEDFVKRAEDRIADMKAQLDTMKEIQSHPIKNRLRNTIKALETKISEIKSQITELKSNIIDGCKNAVAAFKEKGIAALNNLASFFKIKSGLLSMDKNIDASIKLCNQSLSKIELFSREYHTTGRHLKNMGRVLVGKEPIDAVKASGRFAKTVGAPYRADRACLLGMKKLVNRMISALERLEHSVSVKREEKSETKKLPLMVRLKENKELIRQKELEKAIPARAPKAQGIEV